MKTLCTSNLKIVLAFVLENQFLKLYYIKKLSIIVLFVFFFISKNANTQTANFIWAKQIGGAGHDMGNSIAVDASGNVYTTGYFKGTVDFNPDPDPNTGTYNLTSVGSEDVFVSKLDANGNFLWAKQWGGGYTSFGTDAADAGKSIAVDANGNVFTTGHFLGTADFNPDVNNTFPITSDGFDIFVSKLDANGDFVWAQRLGGAGNDFGYSIAVDASGNIYTTGSFQGTADFDPGPVNIPLTSAGEEDIFVSKLSASGNFLWAKRMGGLTYDYSNSIAVDANGNVYTTGYFYGTADFNPDENITYSLTSAGANDIFVSKLGTSGNFLWAKRMGGSASDYGNDITVDASENVYTVGSFQGNVDFDPGPLILPLTSFGDYDIFVSKLGPSGNFLWAKQMGGSNTTDYGYSIAVDANQNVYTTGLFGAGIFVGESADFDPGPLIFPLTSLGYNDIFISKLGPSGNFLWATQMGGTGTVYSESYSIAIDANENVYTTGRFNGTVDFNPGTGINTLSSALGLSGFSSYDIFVVKLEPDPSLVVPALITSPVPSINSYPGLFQSKLPDDLYIAPIPGSPNSTCHFPYTCGQNIFYQSPQSPNNKTPNELIPKARDCFSSLDFRWEFRQRGYITKKDGNQPCNKIIGCKTPPCTNVVTHSQIGCWCKDDRYTWDINLQGGHNSNGICVYAVELGEVLENTSSRIKIKHTNSNGDWYSWYDNVVPNVNLGIVAKNQHLGHIKKLIDSKGSNYSHLHFGVYYLDANNKLISVNRQVDPDYINNNTGQPYTISNLQGTCNGSIVSGAKIYFYKENEWFSGGITDENGRFEVTVIPGLNIGDSIKVESTGYESIKFTLDSTNLNGQNLRIPLLINNSSIGVMYPKVTTVDNMPYFVNPNIQLNISGQNFTTYDILQIYYTEDSADFIPISINHSYLQTSVNVMLADTGINNIGILFKGNDSVMVIKQFEFLPITTNYTVGIISDSSVLSSKLYLDGQYLKDVLQLSESLTLQKRSHSLLFTKLGYRDTVLVIDSSSVINLSLNPIQVTIYLPSDSSTVDFPAQGKIQYRRNVTMLDSAQTSIISIKQFDDNFSGKGLFPKSRKFEFRHLNAPTWSNIKTAMVLDQIENLSVDSIYLMKISNDTIFTKIAFDSTGLMAGYDSLVQKLNYNYINFNNGTVSKQALVIMKKLKPIVRTVAPLNVNQNDSLLIPLSQFFSDPDSVRNDITYQIPNPDPTGLHLSIINGNLLVKPNFCYSGNSSFIIRATHDGLVSSNAINLIVNPLIVQPSTITGNNSVVLTEISTYSINTLANATGYNWQLNGGGTIQSGQNSASIAVYWTTVGNYTLSVNGVGVCGNGPSKTLDITATYGVTGVINPDNQYQIKVVPNPSTCEFYLTAKGLVNKKIRIDILNNLGQLVYKSDQKVLVNDFYKMIDLKKMADGVYYIRLTIENKMYMRKIIKAG